MGKNLSEKDSLDLLVRRLSKSGRYKTIITNVKYQSKLYAGELDGYTESDVGGKTYYHYYEHKHHTAQHLIVHAEEQIERWMQYMHHYHKVPFNQLKGIVYTPHLVKLVHHK